MISRVRVSVPGGPQGEEQVDQAFHAVTLQSTGQAPRLHAWFWTFSVQGWPPNWLLWIMLVVRYWLPAPQVAVQVDQLSWKSAIKQSIGHLSVLHAPDFVRAGQ